MEYAYTVHRSHDAQPLDRVPEQWREAQVATLDHHMGDEPEHRPRVEVRLLHDDSAVYVSFAVNDRYVCATARRHQDPVCIDSCAEFFFTPGTDLQQGYFNIEVNCGGIVLLNHQIARGEQVRQIPTGVIEAMNVRHSMPERVVPEQKDPCDWNIRYRIPIDELTAFSAVDRPAPGVEWRGNFYKCADNSSHPHWLTWAPVDRPTPDFHRKEFFGRIVFA